MSEKEIKLENYLSKSAEDWMVHPIRSNAELTRLAEMLAERHGATADKVYGKTFAGDGAQAYIQLDEERVDKLIQEGWSSLMFMAEVGLFRCSAKNALKEIDFVKKNFRIPIRIMEAVVGFSEAEGKMIRMARASRKHKEDPSQTNLF